MADPKNVREVNIAMDGFTAMVRDQIGRKYFYWVLGLLLIGLGGGITILKQVGDVQIEAQKQGGELRTEIQRQIGDLRTEQQKQVGDVKTDVALGNQTMGRIEKIVGDLQTTQTQAQATLTRMEALLQARSNPSDRLPFAVMLLDENEKQLIFKFITVKAVPGATPGVKVGDVISDPTLLKSVPDDLATAVPRLKGARFLIDENSGSILIVAAGDNRVVAVVGKT
jgi:hypothetical protein